LDLVADQLIIRRVREPVALIPFNTLQRARSSGDPTLSGAIATPTQFSQTASFVSPSKSVMRTTTRFRGARYLTKLAYVRWCLIPTRMGISLRRAMTGAGGQYVLIIPSHQLAIVRLGHYKGAGAGEQALRKAIKIILEAVPSRAGNRWFR
jgi:CubicO group peptidase (beta-lactamase class C family)